MVLCGVMGCYGCDGVICSVMCRYVVLRGDVWCLVALCGVMWRYVELCGAMWR